MLRTLTLTSADGSTEAEFVPDANMLCRSLRHEGTELLDQGHGVEAYAEQGKTMGIPLLHPWANRLAGFEYTAAGKHVILDSDDARIPRDPGGLPIHGVLPGLLRWELEQSTRADQVTAALRWRAELLELFPFAHELRVTATVGPAELAITTTMIPTGPDTAPVSYGYHPYLRLPDGTRQAWRLELGAGGHLVLDDRMIPTGQREPVTTRSFALAGASLDDGYDELSEPPRFEVASDRASLTVEFGRGYRYAQVYAPPDKDFVCFEPMTAPANALRSGDGLSLVAPGSEYRSEFSVALMSR